jgi:hypothetical protein
VPLILKANAARVLRLGRGAPVSPTLV